MQTVPRRFDQSEYTHGNLIRNLTVVSIYGKRGKYCLYGFMGEGTVSVETLFESLSIMVRVFKNWRAPD